MGLRVIGAGFGRTGTNSMCRALNILGVGPTHHMFELSDKPDMQAQWLAVARGAKPDWEVLLDGYNACIDWPSAFYWRELMQAYPDAGVLLTMRSAESWWRSYEKTILQYVLSGDHPDDFADVLIDAQVFGGRSRERDHAIAVYNRHVSDVIATVPPERLLVHNLGDGWGPLCRWLDLPVPEVDYPRGNSSAEFTDRARERGDF